jgi:putative FmdB family regulatory protein
MPLYDYDCAACGRRFEVIHGLYETGPTTCPLCGKGPVRKAVTASAVHYKGSGWAKKERRTTSRKSAEKAEKGESSDAAPTATSTSSESSSESAKDAGTTAAKDAGTTSAKPAKGD